MLYEEADDELTDSSCSSEQEEETADEGPPQCTTMAPKVLSTRGSEVIVTAPRQRASAMQKVLKRPSGLKLVNKTKGSAWVYLESAENDPRGLYDALRHQSGVKGILAAGAGVGRCAALVCKKRCVQLKQGPWEQAYSLGKGRGGAQVVLDLISNFRAAPNSYGDLEAQKPEEPAAPLNVERAVEALKGNSDEELVLMCGNARLKSPGERSELEVVLLRCWSHIRNIRARRAAGGLIHEVSMEHPKALDLDRFQGLQSLRGELYDPVTTRTRQVTFAEFLRNPDLHLRFAACLLGAGGLGKTPLAKSTAVYLAMAYQQSAYNTPQGRCYYVQANSVDTLRACGHVLKSYVPIFVDEFEASDIRQQGPLGENGLKVLCDVPEGGTLRVRFGSIVFPPLAPRLFAANCSGPEGWLKRLGADPVHLGAIRKRVVFFNVSEPLVPAGTQRSLGPVDRPGVMQDALQQARDAMK